MQQYQQPMLTLHSTSEAWKDIPPMRCQRSLLIRPQFFDSGNNIVLDSHNNISLYVAYTILKVGYN